MEQPNVSILESHVRLGGIPQVNEEDDDKLVAYPGAVVVGRILVQRFHMCCSGRGPLLGESYYHPTVGHLQVACAAALVAKWAGMEHAQQC